MGIILLLIFVLAGAVEFGIFLAVVSKGDSILLTVSFFCCAFLAVIGSFLITSEYSYFPNPNTHVFGWPIPRVVFQRDTPTSPWLDYIGPTIILAYPMNFVIYNFVPSNLFYFLTFRRKKSHGNAMVNSH